MTIENNLDVYKSLKEDSNVGWIWLSLIDKRIKSRDFIKLRVNHSSIICVARIIDKNFLDQYNKAHTKKINDSINAIIISEYYRDKLEIQAGQQYEFKITLIMKYNFFSKICAIFQHPDNITKITGWLAVLSILITTIGVIISLFI